MSLPGMYQESHQPQNSVSANNHQSNNPQDNSVNIYRIQLNLSQLAYISKLLPQFYSLQLEPKPLKRAASSQKNIKEELKAPVEIKKKSTKEEIKAPFINKTNSRNQRNNNKFNEEIQNAVYQKYNPQKDISKRNPFQGISESLKPCVKILNLLKNSKTSWPFRQPVDPIAFGIPHYSEIIKQPMDLSSIQNNLKTDQYLTPTQFHADVSKIITNSYTFNSANTQFTKITAQFQAYYRKITAQPNGQFQRSYSHTEIPIQYNVPKASMDKKTNKKQSSKDASSYSGYNGPTITMAQKKELGLNIKKLPKEHMKGKPIAIGEFDLKQLDPNIIRKLQNYVQQKLTGQTKNKMSYGQDKSKQQEERQQSSFQISEDDS